MAACKKDEYVTTTSKNISLTLQPDILSYIHICAGVSINQLAIFQFIYGLGFWAKSGTYQSLVVTWPGLRLRAYKQLLVSHVLIRLDFIVELFPRRAAARETLAGVSRSLWICVECVIEILRLECVAWNSQSSLSSDRGSPRVEEIIQGLDCNQCKPNRFIFVQVLFQIVELLAIRVVCGYCCLTAGYFIYHEYSVCLLVLIDQRSCRGLCCLSFVWIRHYL